MTGADPQPPRGFVRLDVPNDPRAMEQAQLAVVGEMEREGYPKASLFAVRLCVHEALQNALVHGHKDKPGVPAHVQYRVGRDEVEVIVEDEGPGFDPSSIPDPTLDENLERGGGRGLLLIRAYMATAEYNDRGNVLRMVYRRP